MRGCAGLMDFCLFNMRLEEGISCCSCQVKVLRNMFLNLICLNVEMSSSHAVDWLLRISFFFITSTWCVDQCYKV